MRSSARTFNRTAEALEKQVAASRRFVADVSHELRTPLTSMVAVADLLSEEERSADAATAAGIVVLETRRLQQLVGHLLEISRFDADAAELVVDEIEVGSFVTETVTARNWNVQVLGDPALTFRVDPRRFDVIVANLAGNAVRHGRAPVVVSFGLEKGALVLTVSDDGDGIPPQLLPVLFDRFVKGDAARSRSEGSGLGLSIARANAELHGGTLEVENRGGAVFTLRLPAEES